MHVRGKKIKNVTFPLKQQKRKSALDIYSSLACLKFCWLKCSEAAKDGSEASELVISARGTTAWLSYVGGATPYLRQGSRGLSS